MKLVRQCMVSIQTEKDREPDHLPTRVISGGDSTKEAVLFNTWAHLCDSEYSVWKDTAIKYRAVNDEVNKRLGTDKSICDDFCGDFHHKSRSPQVLVVIFTIGPNHHKYLW